MEFICKTCCKSFKFQGSLSRHGRIHKALRVMCDCGLSFSRRDSLNRHQLMSQSCRALEQAHALGTFKSDDSSKSADIELPKYNDENSSRTSMDAFTQTEKHEDTESVSYDNDMIVVEDPNDTSESSETDEDCKIARNPKLISVHKSSEDDDSDSSVPVIKNRKKKHRMHSLKKIGKLRKSKKESLPILANRYRIDLSNQYGIDSFNTYASNIVRKLSTTQNLTRFKPRQHNPSINGVGLLGQLSGT